MVIRLSLAILFTLLVSSWAAADIAFPADIAPPPPFGPTGIATIIGALAVTIAVVLGGFIYLRKKNKQSQDDA